MKDNIFLVKKIHRKRKDNWSQNEDEFLISLTNYFGTKWKFISKCFKNKSLKECYNRYCKINPTVKKGKFSFEEDKLIINFVEENGFLWSKISKILTNRTPKQIRSRYVKNISSKKI